MTGFSVFTQSVDWRVPTHRGAHHSVDRLVPFRDGALLIHNEVFGIEGNPLSLSNDKPCDESAPFARGVSSGFEFV